jgi:hypothetical protein
MNARTNDQTGRLDPPTGPGTPGDDDGGNGGSEEARLKRALRRVVADMTDVRRQRDEARGQVARALRERDKARHERDEAVADLNAAARMVSDASVMVRELLSLPTRERWRGSWIAEAVLSITPPLRDVADLLDGRGRDGGGEVDRIRPRPQPEPEPPAPSPAPQPAEEQPLAAAAVALVCGIAGCTGGCGTRAQLHGASAGEPERCHYRYDDDCRAANADHCRRLGHPEHAGRCPHEKRIGGLL